MYFFSIIINNYNYGRFLGEAIESALAQTYPHREIIVVDDGSTDGSRDVIRSYGDKIKPVFKENGGQASTFNAGWPQARGDLILFLDADDKILNNCLEIVIREWEPSCVKAHYRLEILDLKGNHRGTYPALDMPLASGNVLGQVWEYGFYTGPPCSGNIYSRSLLEKLLPMPEAEFRLCADVNLNLRLSFYGSIIAIDQILGVYRMHGNNLWFGVSITVDLSQLQGRLKIAECSRSVFIQEALRCNRTDPVPDWPMDTTVQRIKMLCLKLDPSKNPQVSASVWQLGWDLLCFTWPRKDFSWKEKASHLVYVIVMTLLPVALINALRKALPAIKRLAYKSDSLLTPQR